MQILRMTGGFFFLKEQNGFHCRRVLAIMTCFIMAMVFDFTKAVANSTVEFMSFLSSFCSLHSPALDVSGVE